MASTSAILPEMAFIEGGRFVMGNDAGRPDERPAHTVALGPLLAATKPVLNRDYARFLEATDRTRPRFWDAPDFNAPNIPVVGVTWFDAVAYCDWLTTVSGRRIRLPTEAEREFAALGGLQGVDWPWGSEPPEQRTDLAEVATLTRPHTPSKACANGYGLFCMADNVHEWCSDWYDATYYARSPETAPVGPASGRRRASRGGAWRHQIKFNRCSARSSLDPSFEYNDYGFRVYAEA